jgi:hypothetical protein
MKQLLFAICTLLFIACKQEPKYIKAENALDAGREFIDAFLDGDTDKATFYMLKDEENESLLKKMHKQLKRRNAEDQKGYKESSIIIGEIEYITEKEAIIPYQSSYDRTGRKVKVVQQNGDWLVDLKYTFNPNM